MTDKLIEKILEALCVAGVTGSLWWVGRAIHAYADSKVKSQAISRDLNHIRNSQDSLSQTIAVMDEKMDDFGARLHELEKKILVTDARVRFSNSGFHAAGRDPDA